MKQKFTITQQQLNTLLQACKPVPYMVIGGMAPASPQDNANRAWCKLGDEVGFDGMTVEPIRGAPMNEFMAEPKAPAVVAAPAEQLDLSKEAVDALSQIVGGVADLIVQRGKDARDRLREAVKLGAASGMGGRAGGTAMELDAYIDSVERKAIPPEGLVEAVRWLELPFKEQMGELFIVNNGVVDLNDPVEQRYNEKQAKARADVLAFAKSFL